MFSSYYLKGMKLPSLFGAALSVGLLTKGSFICAIIQMRTVS
jgi:hypothetical protein